MKYIVVITSMKSWWLLVS